MLEGAFLLVLALVGPGAPSGWVHPERSGPSVVPPADTLLVGIATVPDWVRTGDRFLLRIRLRAPGGAAPEWVPEVPDSLPVMGGLEPRGPGELHRSVGDEAGEGDWILDYPLQALRPGTLPLPPLVLRGGGSTGSDPGWKSLPMGSVRVHAHLPGAEGTVETRPPLPAPLPPWRGAGLLLALSLGGAAVGGAGWLTLRGRAGAPSPRQARPASAPPTRAQAEQARQTLRMLVDTLAGKTLGEKEAREVARGIAAAVRTVLGHELGTELQGLTTSEILVRLGEGRARGEQMEEILRTADRLRFGAPGEPSPGASRLMEGVREWLEVRRA